MRRSAQPISKKAPTQKMERQLQRSGFRWIAGCDEVGRGCLAGPLVTAAVILKPEANLPELADSKLLNPTKRQRLFHQITHQSVAWGIGMVSANELDSLGLTQTTHRAFDQALLHLHHAMDYILVDGQGFSFPTIPFSCITNGDQTVASIAAASVLAKVYRDHLMIFMDQLYPDYGFAKHKGYGTMDHLARLECFGPCVVHRRSFAPVAALVERNQMC